MSRRRNSVRAGYSKLYPVASPRQVKKRGARPGESRKHISALLREHRGAAGGSAISLSRMPPAKLGGIAARRYPNLQGGRHRDGHKCERCGERKIRKRGAARKERRGVVGRTRD